LCLLQFWLSSEHPLALPPGGKETMKGRAWDGGSIFFSGTASLSDMTPAHTLYFIFRGSI
jgi:hypothetical protein